MSNGQSFNFHRLALLTRNTLWSSRSKIVLVTCAVGAFVVLISGLAALGGTAAHFHSWFYPLFLFSSGFIVTSNSFKELRDYKTAGAWLTLPASTPEKFTSRLLLTSPGYFVGTLMLYCGIAVLSEGINRFLLGFAHTWFNPLDPTILWCGAIYMVLQSLFLVGAIYFQRWAFIKTVLFLNVLCIALIVFAFSAFVLLFNPGEANLTEGGVAHLIELVHGEWLQQITQGVRRIVNVLFWVVLAPFCWLVSYYRLKEFEA